MATQVMTFTRTTVGKKVLMAVTGLFMFGFLIAHMLGNLQAWGVFGGEKALVKYAVWLRSMPSLLWAARLVLLGCLAVHTWAAIELLLRNLKSRQALSNRYHRPAPPQAATLFSRTMVISGPIIFAYVVYHLLHLTWGVVHGKFLAGPQNVYHNLITGPIEKKWDQAPLRDEAGQPGQQAQVRRHRRRLRPGRRLGRRHDGRARLQGQVLLLPRQPAPGPQHRGPGRHQRRQELPERRRQHLPAVLRHGQGRRLPLPRGQRLPPGAGQR
jgi:succinate dehydrogenase/fumarate reductase cytochrome b subunit